MNSPSPLHFYYTTNPFGAWSANLSPTHPDQITRDGRPIKYSGHHQLSEALSRLTLHDLEDIFPALPVIAMPAPGNPPAGQLRQTLSYLVDVMTRAINHGVTDQEWDAAIERGQVALAATP